MADYSAYSKDKTEKCCSSCLDFFSVDNFRIRKSKTKGQWINSVCKRCEQDSVSKYRNTKKGVAAEIVRRKKSFCKINELDFDLDRDWVMSELEDQNWKCSLTGLSMRWKKFQNENMAGYRWDAVSVDRINPLGGYTKDNIRFVLNIVNTFRSNGSDKRMYSVAEALLHYKDTGRVDDPEKLWGLTLGPYLQVPKEGFSVILADVPWHYRDRLNHHNMRGAAEDHYPVLKPADLKRLPVKSIAAKDCALFFWVTGPQMDVAIDIIRAWGFEYKTMAFVWRKMNRKSIDTPFYGLGRWTRSNYEYVILATTGKPKRANAGIRQEIVAPIAAHSSKPEEVRKQIDRLMIPGPKVELFARDLEPDWQGTGLELDEMDIRDVLERRDDRF